VARTVLVADDSPTIQKRASGILTGEGIDVVTVSNGVAAIKKLPTVNPLLILADVSMPGKDGYEVCEHVKNTPGISHIPVLLIFSDDDPFEEARAMKAHADGRIKKPFDTGDLVAIAKRYLDQAEAAAKAAADEAARKAAAPAPERPAVVLEPVDAEPEIEVHKGPDPSSFADGIAFSQAFGEEPAAPAPSFPRAAEPGNEPQGFEAAAPAVEAMPLTDYNPAAEPEAAAPEALLPGAAAPPNLPAEESGEPAMVFHAPPEIPEPAMIDEVMNAVDAAAAGITAPVEAAPELSAPLPEDVASSVIAAIPSIADVPAPPEPEPAPAEAPSIEAVAPVRYVDSDLVYAVVLKTVTRMSPPGASAQLIDEMARRLADEITRELETSN
jgi:CheY-like chemotaxis protein